jgi:hypothetical protein
MAARFKVPHGRCCPRMIGRWRSGARFERFFKFLAEKRASLTIAPDPEPADEVRNRTIAEHRRTLQGRY